MITAIIQARTGSRRLPEKVLQPIAGKPLIEHVVRRTEAAQRVGQVVLATTTQPADDRLAAWAEAYGVACFRGSEDDVLDRYYQAAQAYDAEVVVRITGDCPLIDPAVIDATIGLFLSGDYAYINNIMQRTYPDGLDTEVMTLAALETACQEAKRPSEREHVTPFIQKHPSRFPQAGLCHPKNLSTYRWTVDEPADLTFVSRVYHALYATDPLFGMEAVVGLLARQPDLLQINQNIPTNEGYQRAVQQETAAQQVGFFKEIKLFTHEALIPLTAVRGYADLLMRALDGDLRLSEKEQREFLNIIRNGGITLGAYILNMSELVRYDHTAPPHLTTVSPLEVLVDAASKLRKRTDMEKRRLDIQDKPAPTLPPIHADRERLQRILQRVIDNAFLYTPDGGRIILSAYPLPESQAVCFRVDDTGPGILPKDRPHVFERYKRGADHPHILNTPGSGMGLSIAKLYTESMHGKIWFTSQPGEGSSFFIQMPYA